MSLVGAGAMGEVYRARDPKLGRDVALKILPPTFVTDPERVARFRREAQVLASLNHTNIAQIYGLEETGAMYALVMELVDGPMLADRVANGPIPVEEALAIAKQIAEALESAHEQGIVHRDLKPANVKLRADGTVKLLDFGLAKIFDSGGTNSAVSLTQSPTMSVHATQTGVILGTAAYMPPEQARGKAVDRRADIWAFGALLYEMVTGKRAFDGQTIPDVIAAVVTREPDWSVLPSGAVELRRLIARCLNKDVRQRLQAIGDARVEIDEVSRGRLPSAIVLPTPRGRWLLPWIVAAGGIAAGIVAVLLDRTVEPLPLPVMRMNVDLGPVSLQLTAQAGMPLVLEPAN